MVNLIWKQINDQKVLSVLKRNVHVYLKNEIHNLSVQCFEGDWLSINNLLSCLLSLLCLQSSVGATVLLLRQLSREAGQGSQSQKIILLILMPVTCRYSLSTGRRSFVAFPLGVVDITTALRMISSLSVIILSTRPSFQSPLKSPFPRRRSIYSKFSSFRC